MCENTALGPSTKLPHILCAGIGSLQLGVVLVLSTLVTLGVIFPCFSPRLTYLLELILFKAH